MRTMKIWKIVFVMLAAISFASCNSDDNVERRLTTNILVSISLSIRTRIARI